MRVEWEDGVSKGTMMRNYLNILSDAKGSQSLGVCGKQEHVSLREIEYHGAAGVATGGGSQSFLTHSLSWPVHFA